MSEIPSYLTSERDDRLEQALIADIDHGHQTFLEKGKINDLDFHLATLGLVDSWVGMTTRGWWLAGQPTTQNFRMYANEFFDASIQAEESSYDTADNAINLFGYESVLDYLADESLKRTSSERIQGYKPQNIENWIRRGSGYAAFPLQQNLLTRKNQPLVNPSTELLDETIVRVSCVSEALRAIKKRSLEINEMTIGKRQYIESMDGLLLEYDAYVRMLEHNRQNDGRSYWTVPAGPNLDYGPNNTGPKGDILLLVLDNIDPSRNTGVLIDVKSGLGSRSRNRKPIIKNGQARLTARHLGCVEDDDGKEVLNVGKICDDYIKKRNEYCFDERLVSKENRLKAAAAILHLDLNDFILESI